jgi:vacuolar-type H+-ATPase subunit F/Vma7
MERCDKLKYIRNIPVRQLPTIQTGVSIVWLENSQCSPLQDTDIRLGTFNNRCFVVCYSKVSKCVKFLKRARSRDYVIVVIVSYAIEALRRMLYRLQQHRIAQAILVVSPSVDAIDHLLLISDRIIGFQDQKAMLDHLEQLISEIEDQSLGGGLFTTSNRQEKALKDLRLEFGEFIWANIFRG